MSILSRVRLFPLSGQALRFGELLGSHPTLNPVTLLDCIVFLLCLFPQRIGLRHLCLHRRTSRRRDQDVDASNGPGDVCPPTHIGSHALPEKSILPSVQSAVSAPQSSEKRFSLQ